ncbi:MAG: transcription termination/antitermination protein NusG, partial [Candidatus Hodarchaeota archaeon]
KREAEAFRNVRKLGVACLFPKVLDEKFCRGRYTTVEKPLFPSYLFAKLIPSQYYYRVKWTKGVGRFVGWGDMPVPIADKVVEIIRRRMDGRGRVKMERTLKKGEEVRITSGPLRDLIGTFDRKVSASGRVRVLLKLVGNQAVVQLNEALVEQIR